MFLREYKLGRVRRENGSGLFQIFAPKSSLYISSLAAIAMSYALFMWVYVAYRVFQNFYKIGSLPGLLWLLFVVVFTGVMAFVTGFGYYATVYAWRTRNTPLMILGKFRMLYMEKKGRKFLVGESAYSDILRIDMLYEYKRAFFKIHKADGEKCIAPADGMDIEIMDVLREITRRAPWLKQPYSTVPLLVAQSSGGSTLKKVTPCVTQSVLDEAAQEIATAWGQCGGNIKK